MNIIKAACFSIVLLLVVLTSGKAQSPKKPGKAKEMPSVMLIPSQKFIFNSFVDCNMATAWVADTFRIFPGKYGEDPLWGDSRELKYASGSSVDEVFAKKPAEFTEPSMPPNAPAGTKGLHGAVWFEALYKDPKTQPVKHCLHYTTTKIIHLHFLMIR